MSVQKRADFCKNLTRAAMRRSVFVLGMATTAAAFSPLPSVPLRSMASSSITSLSCSSEPSSSAATTTSRRSLLGLGLSIAASPLLPSVPAFADGGDTAVMKINTADGIKGEVEITFLSDAAPKTVEQFKKWVSEGLYDGTAFHRVNQFTGKKVLVGGDPYTKEEKYCPEIKGKKYCSPGDGYGPDGYISSGKINSNDDEKNTRALWDKGGPDGWRKDSQSEVKLDPEFSTPHTRGSIAMRRFRNPDSAGSQFIITLADMKDEMDGQSAVFGKITRGLELLDAMNGKDVLKSASALEFPRDDGKMAITWSAWDRPVARQGIESIKIQ